MENSKIKLTFSRNRVVRIDEEYAGDIIGRPGDYYFVPAGIGSPLETIGLCGDIKIVRVKQRIRNAVALMSGDVATLISGRNKLTP